VPVFNRGERSPIAQLKRTPGVLEISSGKIVHSQAIASGEYPWWLVGNCDALNFPLLFL
jgi:hypothetical protein